MIPTHIFGQWHYFLSLNTFPGFLSAWGGHPFALSLALARLAVVVVDVAAAVISVSLCCLVCWKQQNAPGFPARFSSQTLRDPSSYISRNLLSGHFWRKKCSGPGTAAGLLLQPVTVRYSGNTINLWDKTNSGYYSQWDFLDRDVQSPYGVVEKTSRRVYAVTDWWF